MKKENLILILLPLFFALSVIFTHYQILRLLNPEAHRLTKPGPAADSLVGVDLSPVAVNVPIPETLVGPIHPIPTSHKVLNQLLSLTTQVKANSLGLIVYYKYNADGTVMLDPSQADSEETILSWSKKSIIDAHKRNLHLIFLLLPCKESVPVNNGQEFFYQYEELLNNIQETLEQYHVSFFFLGQIAGSSLFDISEEETQRLAVSLEKSLRKTYTGRIGIGYCCSQEITLIPKGYNSLLLFTDNQDLKEQLKEFQDYYPGIEKLILIDLDNQHLQSF